MDAGHADVVQAFDAVPEGLGRDGRLVRDRQVARAARGGRVDLDVTNGKSLGPITNRRLSVDVAGGAGRVA